MAVILHAADLHLSPEEADYSLAVLDELCELCRRRDAALLLISGDLFDSFDAAEAMRGQARSRFTRLAQTCGVVLIPGNHDQLRSGRRRLESLDLGPVTLLAKVPGSLHVATVTVAGQPVEIEFLAIPHQDNLAALAGWEVPPKRARLRIALAHAVVPGVTYDPEAAFGDHEAGGSVIDTDFFRRCQVDYAALGHIHAGRQVRLGGTLYAYPGSARVWRKGELGPRGVCELEVTIGPDGLKWQVRQLTLAAAGQYRTCTVPLDLDGELRDGLRAADTWQPADWVTLRLSGVVEDEHEAARQARTLTATLRSKVRRLEVDRDEVTALPGISAEPLARRFLRALEHSHPGPSATGLEAWLRARQLGLLEIKRVLESRS